MIPDRNLFGENRPFAGPGKAEKDKTVIFEGAITIKA